MWSVHHCTQTKELARKYVFVIARERFSVADEARRIYIFNLKLDGRQDVVGLYSAGLKNIDLIYIQ